PDSSSSSRSCRKRGRLPGHHLPALPAFHPDVGEAAVQLLWLAARQELDPHLAGDDRAVAVDLDVLDRPLDRLVLPFLRADAVEVARLAVGAAVGMRVDE